MARGHPEVCAERLQGLDLLKVHFVMPNGARVSRATLATFVLFGISLKGNKTHTRSNVVIFIFVMS